MMTTCEIKEIKQIKYKVYKQRWGVLLSAVMLNIACGIIWINNFPVATTVAQYYGRPVSDVNWFSSLFLLGALPFTIIGSLIADKFGLKILLQSASALNLTGAVIRAVATSHLFPDKDTQFFIGIFGQTIAAAANSFVLGIAPKISQKWFSESERGLATAIGAMARPMGVVIAQLSVPAIVKTQEDVPLNDAIWVGPSVLAQALTLIFVTREDPKTPPSRSAGLIVSTDTKASFTDKIKSCFSSFAFIIIFTTLGGGMGILFSLGTLTEQILCPLGYTQTFSGIANGVMILSGFVGSAVFTIMMKKGYDYIYISKIACAALSLSYIALSEFYLLPDREILICLSACVFGFSGFGLLPLALELAVEATYPVDEAITGLFIYMSGQIHGMIFIILVTSTATETQHYSFDCGGYTNVYNLPVTLVMVILLAECLFAILFLKTEYKRKKHEMAFASEEAVQPDPYVHKF